MVAGLLFVCVLPICLAECKARVPDVPSNTGDTFVRLCVAPYIIRWSPQPVRRPGAVRQWCLVVKGFDSGNIL